MSAIRRIAPIWSLGLVLLAAAAAHAEFGAVTNNTFVAFDIETTDLSRDYGRVIEIGAVKFRNNHVIHRKAWLINPGIPIPPAVTGVHGITDAMVADAPAFSKAYAEFLNFIGESVLLAHNARFDVGFLEAEARRNALMLPPNQVIDTLQIARKCYPKADNHRLESLVNMLGLPPGKVHRGLADSDHLRAIFLKMTAQDPYGSVDVMLDLGGITFQDPQTARKR
ncbi:MAG: 3'-5' exonuclease [Verrucomicrobia bacterium]|nr:3'-5' exonuclease [Verrucomicrobiota bacterium]